MNKINIGVLHELLEEIDLGHRLWDKHKEWHMPSKELAAQAKEVIVAITNKELEGDNQ